MNQSNKRNGLSKPEAREVIIHLEGAVVHDVTCPEGVRVHIIDANTDELFDEDLCPGCKYCDSDHRHAVWSHHNGQTIQAEILPPESREDRLARVADQVRAGTYDEADPRKMEAVVDKLHEVICEGRR